MGLKTYSVHRIVLANASKYFHGLFLSGFCSGASTINRETSFSTGNAANSSSLSTQVDGQYNAPASAEKGNIGLDEADDAIHDNDNDTNHPLYSISTKRKNNDVSSHTIDAGQQISTDGDRLTVLELPARTEAHFDAVLTYIYDGTVTLNPRNAIPLLVLADMLMIDDLQRSIKRYIQLTLLNNSHKPNHMCWFLKTACEYGGHGDLLDIQHRCLSWMAENLEKTFSVIPHLPPDLFSMILNGASFSSVKRRAIAHYLAHTLWSIPKKKLLELIHRAETKVSHSVLASSLRMCLLCTVDADEERGGTGDGEPNLPGLSMNLQVSPEASTVAKKSVTYDESMNFDRSSSSSIQDEQGQAEFFFSTLSSLTEYYNAKVPLEKLESILVASTQHAAAISDQSFDGGDNTGAPADSKEVIRVQLDEADVFASTVNGVSMAVLLLMLHSDTLHVSCEDDVLNFVEAVVSVFLKSGFIMDQQQCTPQQQLFLSLMWSPVRWSFISSRKKVSWIGFTCKHRYGKTSTHTPVNS